MNDRGQQYPSPNNNELLPNVATENCHSKR